MAQMCVCACVYKPVFLTMPFNRILETMRSRTYLNIGSLFFSISSCGDRASYIPGKYSSTDVYTQPSFWGRPWTYKASCLNLTNTWN